MANIAAVEDQCGCGYRGLLHSVAVNAAGPRHFPIKDTEEVDINENGQHYTKLLGVSGIILIPATGTLSSLTFGAWHYIVNSAHTRNKISTQVQEKTKRKS